MIEKIIIKYLFKGNLVLEGGGKPDNQLISATKDFGGLIYKLEFIQVINDELHLIYNGEEYNYT